jgi:Zn-dependent protease
LNTPETNTHLHPEDPQSRAREARQPAWLPVARRMDPRRLLRTIPRPVQYSIASAELSLAVYIFAFGWRWAVGVLALLVCHEMGHLIQLHRERVKAPPPIFLPFIGAVIRVDSFGPSALSEARVGLAGPLLGGCAAGVSAIAGVIASSTVLLEIAFLGCLINLVNLMPVLPLDGGRTMAAVLPQAWIIGALAAVGLVVILPDRAPGLIVILALGLLELRSRWRQRKQDPARAYHALSTRDRLAVAAVYLGLVLALLGAAGLIAFAITA